MKPKPKKWRGETFDAWAAIIGDGKVETYSDGIPCLYITETTNFPVVPVTVSIKPRAARKKGKR